MSGTRASAALLNRDRCATRADGASNHELNGNGAAARRACRNPDFNLDYASQQLFVCADYVTRHAFEQHKGRLERFRRPARIARAPKLPATRRMRIGSTIAARGSDYVRPALACAVHNRAAQAQTGQQGGGGLGNRLDGTEQPVRFLVNTRGEIQRVGSHARPARAETQRPQPVVLNGFSRAIGYRTKKRARSRIEGIDIAMREVSHQKRAAKIAKRGRRERDTPRCVERSIGRQALLKISINVEHADESARVLHGAPVCGIDLGIGCVQFSVYILDIVRGESRGQRGVDERTRQRYGQESGTEYVDPGRAEIAAYKRFPDAAVPSVRPVYAELG